MSSSAQQPPAAAKRPPRARATNRDAAVEANSEAAPTADAPTTQAPAGQQAPPKKPGAEIAHATRGRVRIKIPAGKSNPELLHQIRAAFEGHAGIDAIDVKQSTGSIVIYYDPEHHEDIPSLFASMDKAAAPPMAHLAPLATPPPVARAPAHHQPANKLAEEIDAIEAEA